MISSIAGMDGRLLLYNAGGVVLRFGTSTDDGSHEEHLVSTRQSGEKNHLDFIFEERRKHVLTTDPEDSVAAVRRAVLSPTAPAEHSLRHRVIASCTIGKGTRGQSGTRARNAGMSAVEARQAIEKTRY